MLGPNNGVCKQVSATPANAQLLDDSVVHPGAVMNHPKTRVYFLFGALDCGEPVPAGLAYAELDPRATGAFPGEWAHRQAGLDLRTSGARVDRIFPFAGILS